MSCPSIDKDIMSNNFQICKSQTHNLHIFATNGDPKNALLLYRRNAIRAILAISEDVVGTKEK